MPDHGDMAACRFCHKQIEYIVYSIWNGTDEEVLDTWWSHVEQANDRDHDAEVHGA